MREKEFEIDFLIEAIPGVIEEKFDPEHQSVEQSLSLEMDLVDKGVEGLFVALNEVDEHLDGTLWVFLADYEDR